MIDHLRKNWLVRRLKVLYYFFDILFKSWVSEIFIVYQMGKVGSSTIYKSLLENGENVYHVHRINRSNIKSIHREYKKRNINPPDDSIGLALNLYLKLFTNDFNYIVGMRDPIARNFSSYFQNIERYGDEYNSLQNFIKTYDHEVPLRWFKEEFNKILKVNVCNLEGLHEGCIFLKKGDKSIFIYKLEAGMDVIINELEKAYNLDIEERKDSNIANNKEYASEYARLKRKLSVSEELLDFVYKSDITQAFYSKEEIKEFRAKWS